MKDYNTYDAQIDYLRTFINKRMAWIDNTLNSGA